MNYRYNGSSESDAGHDAIENYNEYRERAV